MTVLMNKTNKQEKEEVVPALERFKNHWGDEAGVKTAEIFDQHIGFQFHSNAEAFLR